MNKNQKLVFEFAKTYKEQQAPEWPSSIIRALLSGKAELNVFEAWNDLDGHDEAEVMSEIAKLFL